MLIEIKCDKFRINDTVRNPIIFHEGLNTVIGETEGDNSIGKSTILMIIDFVFGGNDYIFKLRDVHNNVNEHTIQFAFKFEETVFKFCRSTDNYLEVLTCDEYYTPIEDGKITLKEYHNFLKEKYNIPEDHGTFRKIAGRFFRIYNRSNMDERHPLTLIGQESNESALDAFLDIMGLNCQLIHLKKASSEANNEYKYFKEAQQRGDKKVSKNKTEYRNNFIQIELLKKEIAEFDEGLLSSNSIKIEGLSQINKDLSKLQYKRSKLNSNLLSIKESNTYFNNTDIPNDFESLKVFFPKINLKKLEDIQIFHKRMAKILEIEISEEIENLIYQIDILTSEIEKIKNEKQLLSSKMKISSSLTLKKLDLSKNKLEEIDLLKNKNNNFDEYNNLFETKKAYQNNLSLKRKEVSKVIINSINENMKKRNNEINENQLTTSPTINLTPNGKNYIFQIKNDQGAGTQYKGMILFDLAMLELSCIPALIHDSDLLKPVGDFPVSGIAKQYQNSKKQIFIAIDKIEKYPEDAKKIFEDTQVIRLSANGGELFGKAWNKI